MPRISIYALADKLVSEESVSISAAEVKAYARERAMKEGNAPKPEGRKATAGASTSRKRK